MDLQERIRRLSLAGVEVIRPWPISDVVVTPPDVAWDASACGRESGRQDRAVDYADPDRSQTGNAGWSELAHGFDLMTDDGSFLLSLPVRPGQGALQQWFEVRLHTDWDLVGVGAEQRVLGYGHGDPSFAMHSVDGRALVAATWYETCFSILAVPNPRQSPALRRSARRWIDDVEWPDERRLAAQGWLNQP